MPLDFTNGEIKNARALFYKIENADLSFLLTQEDSGSYTLPGGCKDIEDPDLITTMKRELKEELQITDKAYSMRETDINKEYKNLYTNPSSERFDKPTVMTLFLVEYNGQETIHPGNEIIGVIWLREGDVQEKLGAIHMKELFILGVGKLKNIVFK